jgi:outer membrane protein OmpA-like peptidoglycan-associated protein
LRNCFIIIIVLASLLMQACSTTNVVTSIVPGRELSRTSLGERELENKVIIDEVEPLSVKVYRRISKVEYTRSEYKAVKETRHEKYTYECSNAYDRYPAFLLTTLAVPVLYEMATGFDILREMCDKNPPITTIETAETGQTLSSESFDKNKIVNQDIPLVGEQVTLVIDKNRFVATTSSAGIAEFPAKEISSFYDKEKSRSIDYQYNDLRLSRPFKMQEPNKEEKPAQSSESATAPDDASTNVAASAAPGTEPGAFLSPGNPDPVTMIGDQKVAPGPEQENKQAESKPQEKETLPPEKSGTAAGKPNKAGQGYTNEDQNVKIVQKGKSIRITNKSNLAMTIKKVAVHYNGRTMGNLLYSPLVILPKSTSPDLNRNNVVGEEFDDVKSFGIAVSYQIRSADREKSLSLVNRHEEDKVTEDPAESARLLSSGADTTAKPAVDGGSKVSVPIDAEKISGSSAISEWKITLNIKFDSNKTTIRKEFYPGLEGIGKTLRENPRIHCVIEGHTDNVGSKELNRKISVRRAEAVAQHIIKKFGIEPDRIRVEGFGMSRPLTDNNSPEGRAKNRRIEVKFRELPETLPTEEP